MTLVLEKNCCRCDPVAVIDKKIQKPYLGGWRNKITEVEFFNAESQTGPRPKSKSRCEFCTVYVQCIEDTDKAVQTYCHRATQMWRKDCYIPNVSDKFLTASPYETYEEKVKRLNLDHHARVIQRAYRLYRLLKYMKECAAKYRRIKENCERLERRRIEEYNCRHKREILETMDPRSRADLSALYNLIDNWRLSRLSEIKARHFPTTSIARGAMLLGEQVELLKRVDEERQLIVKGAKQRGTLLILENNCKALKWRGYKDIPIQMITLRVQRAREWRRIYNDLKAECNISERINVLALLRSAIAVHYCQDATEFIELLDQEIAILSRGLPSNCLKVLRERILLAYLHFVDVVLTSGCDCEDINANEMLAAKVKTLMCKRCRRLLPYKKFTEQSVAGNATCAGCSWLLENNLHQVNYKPYEYMLDSVKTCEQKQGITDGPANNLTLRDFYYLVNNIWHGRSAVSGNADPYVLRMVRFTVDEEWSPWNCILLTEEEAAVHSRTRLPLDIVYSPDLLRRTRVAHVTARKRFHRP